MDGSCKGSGAGNQNTDPNMSTNPPPAAAAGDDVAAAAEGRRPFTSLSQEEADLALSRVLQQQERAYMMLTGQGCGGYDYDDDDDDGDEEEEEDASDYEEEEGEALDEDEEVGDGAEVDLDPARYDDDEAYARVLHDAEERDVSGRLMALAGFGRTMEQDDADVEEDEEDEDGDPEDAWEDIDPDEYSYEELVALGEVVGTESKGLPADTISSLPSVTYQAQDRQDGNMEQCVICRVEFEEGESLVALPCKHPYHSECINHWLKLNKVCPMCSAEVPTSVNFNGKN